MEIYKNKVFIGMYHDQVLIPFKTINKFDGINITIGKKFYDYLLIMEQLKT